MEMDKKAKAVIPAEPETLIYLGPTFRQPVLLMYGSVFRGGLAGSGVLLFSAGQGGRGPARHARAERLF